MQIKLCGDTGDAATIPDTAHAQKQQDVSTLLSHTLIQLATADSALNVVCRHLLHVTSLQSRLAERDKRALLSTTCHRKTSSLSLASFTVANVVTSVSNAKTRSSVPFCNHPAHQPLHVTSLRKRLAERQKSGAPCRKRRHLASTRLPLSQTAP